MLKLRQPTLILVSLLGLIVFASTGCGKTEAHEPAPQAFPVHTQTVNLAPVPRVDEYVATVKSRRSASIQPQVDGSLTRILVKSGDRVRAGQVLMTIDPLKQQATVDQQRSTETQKKATLDYNQHEVERQRQLYESGVSSKRDYEIAVQAYDNSKADWQSSTAARVTQQLQLAYYNLTAPFAGIVGDIPVHIGDYVSPPTFRHKHY
jgi:RND family efflux transporter MFP subunit